MTSLDLEGALGFGVGLGAGLAFRVGVVQASPRVWIRPAVPTAYVCCLLAGVLRGVFLRYRVFWLQQVWRLLCYWRVCLLRLRPPVGGVVVLPFDLFLGGMTGLRESVFSSSSSSALAAGLVPVLFGSADGGARLRRGVSLGTGLFLNGFAFLGVGFDGADDADDQGRQQQ